MTQETKTARCKRCGHTERYAGPLLGGICGNCGDDLRQELQAEWASDLMENWDERSYNAREEAAYDAADKATGTP